MARLLEIPIKADLIKKSTNTYSINADSTGVYFKIDILKNGEKFDLTDKTVRAYMLKKDKKVIYIDCTLENKNDEIECFLDVTTQMLNAEYLTVQFLITDTEGSTVVSNPVYIAIGDTVIDTEAIESSNEFSALTEALLKVNNLSSTASPLVANTVADMTDSTRCYVYTGTEEGYSKGYLYYWNGTAWTKGWLYQSEKANAVDVTMADGTDLESTVGSLKEDLVNKASKETVTNIANNIDTINNNISNLDETKANKNEIANGLNAKGACLYTELPTEGNSNGDYYYCSDGNGTDGAGNYVWNGTAWFFGGLGNNFGAKNVKLTDGTNIEDNIINLNKNKLNYYNVKSYGLDESKTPEENTRILQNLIDYIYNNGGGIIYIPNGDYHFCISDTTNYYSILLKPNVSIIGENKYKTKLIMDNGDTPYTFMWRNTGADTPLENAHFEKFSVIGTALTEWHVRAKAFFAQYVKHCVFKDLYLEGTPATALGIDFLDDVTIDHITCKDCGHLWTKGRTGSAGIGIGTGGYQDENFIITNNVCVGCGQYGIFVENQNTIFKKEFMTT